jgi:HSP20 family molecular chaperone IbpA
MIIKTILPNLGDVSQYLGKPVKDRDGNRIGGIVDVVADGDHIEVSMEIPGIYSEKDLINVFKRSV